MYNNTMWFDDVTEFEDRFKEVNNGDGTITHVPVTGEIIQDGTPQNADNFNHMEEGIVNAIELASLLATNSIHMQQSIDDLMGEKKIVEIKNNQTYPFNDSSMTIALDRTRNHTDYTVEAEIENYSGGFPGEIIVSDKLLNGFKIHFTGSASTVDLKLYIKGGFYGSNH